LTTYLTFVSTTIAFFIFLNESISSEIKKKISRWLRNIKPDRVNEGWPHHFISIFDTIFTNRHFSIKCFFRSCIASLIAIFILTLVWCLLRNTQIRDFINDTEFFNRALLLIPGIVLINLLADYVSLLETRYLIKLLGNKYSTVKLWIIIAVDTVLTFVILMAFTIPYFNFIYFRHLAPDVTSSTTIDYLFSEDVIKTTLNFDVLETGWFSMSPLFYSTFFTSVWLWIYIAAGSLVKIGYRLRQKLSLTLTIFDIEKKPLYYIGFVAIFLQTLIYIISFVFW
jgi:hypothetical protein